MHGDAIGLGPILISLKLKTDGELKVRILLIVGVKVNIKGKQDKI